MLPLLLLGGGVLLFLAFSSHSANASPALPGQPAQPLPGLPQGPGVPALPQASNMVPSRYDGGRPIDVDLQATIDAEIANDKDPSQLRAFADSLLPDYPGSSGQVLTLANALAVNPQPQPPQPQPQPIPIVPPVNPNVLPPVNPNVQRQPYSPALPSLPAIPVSFKTKTAQHATDQSALSRWAAQVNFIDPSNGMPFLPSEADGVIGPISQRATASFQVWANDARAAGLTVDGLPGPHTEDQLLAEFGTNVVVIPPVIIGA